MDNAPRMATVPAIHVHLIQLVCLLPHQSKVVDIKLNQRVFENGSLHLEPRNFKIRVEVDMPFCAQQDLMVSPDYSFKSY